jgi:hypothetical protein
MNLARLAGCTLRLVATTATPATPAVAQPATSDAIDPHPHSHPHPLLVAASNSDAP